MCLWQRRRRTRFTGQAVCSMARRRRRPRQRHHSASRPAPPVATYTLRSSAATSSSRMRALMPENSTISLLSCPRVAASTHAIMRSRALPGPQPGCCSTCMQRSAARLQAARECSAAAAAPAAGLPTRLEPE
jgi:hypothetical protein